MNVIVHATGLTEESFRNNEKLRGQLHDFIQSDCGSALLFLLKERAKIKAKPEAVPADAIAQYSIAELSRFSGIQTTIDLIVNLCNAPATAAPTVGARRLGVHTEEDLPPKFEVKSSKPTTPTP